MRKRGTSSALHHLRLPRKAVQIQMVFESMTATTEHQLGYTMIKIRDGEMIRDLTEFEVERIRQGGSFSLVIDGVDALITIEPNYQNLTFRSIGHDTGSGSGKDLETDLPKTETDA